MDAFAIDAWDMDHGGGDVIGKNWTYMDIGYTMMLDDVHDHMIFSLVCLIRVRQESYGFVYHRFPEGIEIFFMF